MGWWNYGVMDGDTPMDVEHAITIELMGVERPDDDEAQADAYAKRLLEELRDPRSIQHLIEFEPKARERLLLSYEYPIYMQVLGAMVMRAGGPIDTFKDKLVKAIADDHWASSTATDARERQKAMAEFAVQVYSYVGKPVEVNRTGLFETIDKMIDRGERGLINKGGI